MAASNRTDVSSNGRMYSENINSEITWVFPPDASIASPVKGPKAAFQALDLNVQMKIPK